MKRILPLFCFPMPLCLGLLLLGLAFIWFSSRQKAGKILVSAGTGLLLVCSFGFVPELALRHLERMYPPVPDLTAAQTASTSAGAVKYIVVLGGGHVSDPQLPVTSQIRGQSLYRVLEGVRLYKARPGAKLIFSGGGAFDPVPESQVMVKVALIMGVNPQDILLESTSRDTEEQARLLKPLVGRDVFFLVTSASHLPRAMAMFRKLEMAPVAAPAGHRVRQAQQRSPEDFLPGSEGLTLVEIALHEYLGLAWARLRGVI